MTFDKTIEIVNWSGESIKHGDSVLTLGEAICVIISNQNEEKVFEPHKAFALISKIAQSQKNVDLDKSDFDNLIKAIEKNLAFQYLDKYIRGFIIDVLKKEITTPKNKAVDPKQAK